MFSDLSPREATIARIRYGKAGFFCREMRVDHAGEYGALRIYEGQMCVLKSMRDVLSEMRDQELGHFFYFDELIRVRCDVSPTLLLPLWHYLGFLLGFFTAVMGPKFAMLCTVAVEEVISKHYAWQLVRLEDSDVAVKIEEFLEDELEHKNIAAAESVDVFGSGLFTCFIGTFCRFAIVASKFF